MLQKEKIKKKYNIIEAYLEELIDVQRPKLILILQKYISLNLFQSILIYKKPQ